MPDAVRILGIDPGSNATGYGVVDSTGASAGIVDHGVVRLPAKQPLVERLCLLDTKLRELVEQFRPDEVVVEQAFAAVNIRSALVLGQVRGVVIAAAGSSCPVFEYAPRAVKKAVTGYGQADKNQVAQMVMALLELREPPPQDAADALALALCHLHTRRFTAQLEKAR